MSLSICPATDLQRCLFHHIAQQQMQVEALKQRQKFRPAQMVQQVQTRDQVYCHQSLTKAVKSSIAQEEEQELKQHLYSLSHQGKMARRFEGTTAKLWAKSMR